MTKIRNTKKGIAKKTLSISLAVAMLATSNVPVWAAEDLFTDGEVAVEAFTADEVVEEAPVVEDVEEVVDAQAVGSEYPTEFKDFKADLEWGENYTYKIKVTTDGTTAVSGLKARWVDENGNASTGYDMPIDLTDADGDGYFEYACGGFDHDEVGKKFRIQVYEDGFTWSKLSPVITVGKKAITGEANWAGEANASRAVVYNGKQISDVPAGINGASIAFKKDGSSCEVSAADRAAMTFDNFYHISGDTINSVQVSGESVVAETDIISDYYTGKVEVTFDIWRKDLASIDDIVTVTPAKSTYMYTGKSLTVEKEDFTVTEKLGGVVEGAAANANTLDGAVGTNKDGKVAISCIGSLRNYTINGADWTSENASFKYNVVKRDLADTANTKMTVKPIVYSNTVVVGEVTAADVMNNLTIKDADGTRLDGIEAWVDVVFENNSTKLNVKQGETYKATIKAKTNVTPNDSENIINDRVVEFTVVGNDLSAATFKNEGIIEDTQYAATQITYGLTKDNLKEKLGDLQIKENGVTRTLIPNDGSTNPEYDMNVVFGENTNVGVATITINGLGTYAGTQKVITFNIIPAKAEILTVPAKTLFKEANRYAKDYNLDVVVTTKEFTDANGNKQTLTVPASDYVVTQEYVDGNGDGVAENAVLDKIETSVADAIGASGNFTVTAVAKETIIVNKAITDADVVLEKTEYTYNASRVMPEYKVVVDGVTLEKGKDYTEVVTHNTHVGEATLKITGKGDYDSTTSVIKKFTIVAANVADVKVAVAEGQDVSYNGYQHVGETTTAKLVFTIDGNEIDHTELTALYPTSKAANINAGNGTVTLVPNKDAEYKNFVGEGDFTFTIAPAVLGKVGTLTAYDANGTKVDFSKVNFKYDGTAHKFASVDFKYVPAAPMKFTENDYDIIYKDNTVGDANGKGHILVIAKGNYAGEETNDYTCADESVVKNVIASVEFNIAKVDIASAEAVVENGVYAEGKLVDPVVKVTYKGKELVKDVDFELDYSKFENEEAKRTEVTNGKTLHVEIKGKGGYNGWVFKTGGFAWGIDKFDLENAEVIVSGTDVAPVIKVLNSGIVVDAKEYTVDTTTEEGKAIITAAADSKHYTGSKKVDIKVALEKPGKSMIERVEVTGNKAKVILTGEVEGAIGYDYVISTNRNCIVDKDYAKVNKNKLTTNTTFQYVQQDMYYAYCHAWTRDENGKKVFGDWSEAYPFSVTAITPAQPVITGYKVNGSTVTVTYTKAADADGYDVVLGTTYGTVADEKRPLEYGELVKKNIKGNTVTATFKNVPKGTYYAGLHAFNRTSEDGKKVFSPWSNIKTIKVK